MPDLYPAYLVLDGRPCLVVGGGEVAWRKIEALLRAGARVSVVAPVASPEVRAAAARGDLALVRAEFAPSHLDGQALCFAATGDPGVNRAVAAEARRRGVPANVVDQPELCDFQVPAVVRRGSFQVAVSSGGRCPLLAARVRRELEGLYSPGFGALADLLGRVREDLRRTCPDEAERRRRLEAAADAALAPGTREAAGTGDLVTVEDTVRRAAGLLQGSSGRAWRVGSRASRLAVRQAELVVEALRRAGNGQDRFELVAVRTTGDADTSAPIPGLATVGAFTGELERALLEGRIDFAVHSLKDLPTSLPPGLTFVAAGERADPRDVLVSRDGRTLADLAPGAVVGTSSPRRAALLRRHRPDLVCRPLRGNVETRLRRLDEGDFDAVILAAAGLERLGLGGRGTERLDPRDFPPAPAQGVLALEFREADAEARALAVRVEDPAVRLPVEAERAFLRRLGAGCRAAAGALARLDPATGRLELSAVVLGPDGREILEGNAAGEVADPRAAALLGASLAEDLLARGADGLVGLAVPAGAGEPVGPAVPAGAGEPVGPAVPAGTVYLVGAGPGDPGLLTLKGADVLSRADCVVLDRLAPPALLELVRPRCEVVFAGKEAGRHSLPQEDITRLLIDRARRGLCVVRLKGGDPFVFGRGGEEAQALRAAGVRYEIVPGVTSAVAGPAYAGIPVTHRGLSSSVAVVTGHEADPEGGRTAARDEASEEPAARDEASEEPAARDEASGVPAEVRPLARSAGTLVVLMGLRRLAAVVEEILAAGRPPETPAAVISSAATADQRTVTGSLGDIAARAAACGVVSPALLVVGEVAALREELAWFEELPLAGRRIVLTRPRERSGGLALALGRLGAEVFVFPAARVEPAPDGSPGAADLEAALDRLETFDWIAFTSATGVEVFFDRLTARGLDARSLAGRRVAAIGPATARRLAARGVRADVVPAEFRGEALAAALAAAAGHAPERDRSGADAPGVGRPGVGRPGRPGAGPAVLLVRSDQGREEVAAELSRRGFEVEDLAAYVVHPELETPARAVLRENLTGLLAAGRVDALTFASSAAVRYFLDAVGRDWLTSAARHPAVFCIGPVTAETAAREGLAVTATATEYTAEGLLEVVLHHFRKEARRPCWT